MVAAGGGGDDDGAASNNDGKGGYAGGLTGYTGVSSGIAGSQNLGAGFGIGAQGTGSTDSGGGGGGYYGGVGSGSCDGGGAGGSSYISGHAGCSSIYESSSNVNIVHSGGAYHYSGKYFIDTEMIDGAGYKWSQYKINEYIGMPNHAGTSIMTGNSGHGYAKITLQSIEVVHDDEISSFELENDNVWTFPYNGNYQTFTVPKDGYYRVQLWGAQGGSYYAYGGYTAGEISLSKNDMLYVYTGEKGGTGTKTRWNGGGGGGNGNGNGGGGATDIRKFNTSSLTIWNESESLKSRIMVAAGGGGDDDGAASNNDGKGGYAGGLTGYKGVSSGIAGSQINGAAFGYGAQGTGSTDSGGGGGGYFGGVGSGSSNGGGAGGSSYISGHAGCIGVDSSGTLLAQTYSSLEDSINYTGYKFANTNMIDGSGYPWATEKATTSSGMPSATSTSIVTGNSGHGYAKITYLGE